MQIGQQENPFTTNVPISMSGALPAGTNILGSIYTKNSLITAAYDYIGVAYPDTSTEVYTYKTGGSGGTTVGTITCVYSDAVTKLILTSVTKS